MLLKSFGPNIFFQGLKKGETQLAQYIEMQDIMTLVRSWIKNFTAEMY